MLTPSPTNARTTQPASAGRWRPAARNAVHAASAQRQDVVDHVPDHHRGHETARLAARREEIAPAPGADEQPDDAERRRHAEPAPVRARELGFELGDVDATEEPGEQGDTDRDA